MLIDFEVAGFGHVLREAAAPRLIFTEGDNSALLPLELVRSMEGAYQAAFGTTDDSWSHELALCSAFHVIGEVGWDLRRSALDWRTSYRCEAIVEIAEEAGLVELAKVFATLGSTLRSASTPPIYPVFA